MDTYSQSRQTGSFIHTLFLEGDAMKKTTLYCIIACLALLVQTPRKLGSSFEPDGAVTRNLRNSAIISGDPVVPPPLPPPPPNYELTRSIFMA